MKPNRKIVAMAWRYYHNNHTGRTADKPFRGENWAQVLLAFGVPEDELYPDDRNRGLQRMTSAEAATKKWWKWKKVFAPELKRMEEANSDSCSHSVPDTSVADQQRIKEDALKQAEENAKIKKIIAESRADAKMWLIVDYPNRDAVELGEPRYWVFWYDPQFNPKDPVTARGKIWNWLENCWTTMWQSPHEAWADYLSVGAHYVSDGNDGSVKIQFSDKYEENRSFDTESAMLLEEWEHLMRQSPEGEKYLKAQDPNNMPLPNIAVPHSQGRSGHGKMQPMYVDKYGWVWDREADMEAGEPPLNHIIDSAHEALKERLLALFPTAPDKHPSRQ